MVSFSPPPAARAKAEIVQRLKVLVASALGELPTEQQARLSRITGQLKGTGVADLEQLVKDLISARKP